MLSADQQEIDHVTTYFEWQAPDLKVEFIQKVYVENVLGHRHEVWDVHTDKDRWWVITNPMNLYSQQQFPNMDLAVTFHVGLCLRIPQNERQKLSDLPIEPFAECYRYLSEAFEALSQAEEVSDYQSVGVRCREALLSYTDAAQTVLPWASVNPKPKRADLRAWAEHICSVTMAGASHKERRRLFKTLLEDAWMFSNWLTHSKSSSWHDAEAAVATTENAIGLCTSSVIRHMRGVPEACPACGSRRLSPERGFHQSLPDLDWERPVCGKCGWIGEPVPIVKTPLITEDEDARAPDGECVAPTVPLRTLIKP